MRISQDVKLDFNDVLLVPKRSNLRSRADVVLERAFYRDKTTEICRGIPIIAANMFHTGTIDMACALATLNCYTALHKFHSLTYLSDFFSHEPSLLKHTWISVGISEEQGLTYEDAISLYRDNHPNLKVVIDVPNGYLKSVLEVIKNARQGMPQAVIMAGNIATRDVAYDILSAGADICKVGLGPGSHCLTRRATGVGYPQLSAIDECADVAHSMNKHICADGGCQTSGDIAKALAAGADMVMIGGMLAAHDESNGRRGDKYEFYGMSSKEALENHMGGAKSYRAPEGSYSTLEPRGPVQKTMGEILGGLRSTCTYCGASTIKDLPKCASFIRVNRIK